ncbi:PREDICTED: probable cytochrome P450 49a1 [Papilio polytes]|uniref:probable cytochrome P450 49a1 n=1 Tax=Papilio polytes TaxID=76194 RepID=UPI000676AE91|nr:PREDICTED: probable cytochrome P450 49a1 [Papilio polytes]
MFKYLKSTKESILCLRQITTAINIDVTASPTKPFNDVPGPTALPGIGQLYHFLPGGSLYNLRGYDLQNFLYKKYGPVVRMKGHFGANDSILLFDPEVAIQIYRSENAAPVRIGSFAAQHYKTVFKKETGRKERRLNGLIFDHEDKWREIRTAVNPFMMQAKSLKIYSEALDEIALEAVARLKSIRNENNMIENNLLDEFMLYVLEFTGQIALGRRFDSFATNASEDVLSRQLLYNAHNLFTLSDKLDYLPNTWRLYPNKTFRKAMKFFEEVEKFNENLLRDTIEKQKTNPMPEDTKGVILKLAEMNMDVALAFLDDFFFVGIDTTANATLSVLYLLATNPDKQTKLREEIMAKGSRRPYLRACIKEAARIRPVLLGNFRLTTTSYNVFGYEIPKDTMILFCHEQMSRREEQYPQPHLYIPERWLVDQDHPLYHGNAHPNAAVHFGYGARGCVGRKVADMVMELFISSVIENFRLEWRGKPMPTLQSVTNHNIGPYNIVFNDV